MTSMVDRLRTDESQDASVGRLLWLKAREIAGDVVALCASTHPRFWLRGFLWLLTSHRSTVSAHEPSNATREVTLGRSGATIIHRDNGSDRQMISEVLLHEAYSPPASLEQGSVAHVVDLGANIGCASIYFSGVFPKARILAVEPVAETAAVLEQNLARNDVSATTLQSAVARKSGPVTLFVSEWWASSTTTRKVAQRRASQSSRPEATLNSEQRTVPGVSIGELFETHGLSSVDILKIDVEGAEEELLQGSEPWLSIVKAVVMEFHDKDVDSSHSREVLENAGLHQTVSSGRCSWFVRR